MQPLWHPSPNFASRRGGARPSLIVLHYTAMETCDAARDRLCDPAIEVSAHYLISQTGLVLWLVAEDMRAWHAGAGEWGGITDVNSHSIGIELANTGAQPFPHPQMCALEALLRTIMARWAIPPHNIIGHSDMAPARKSDPGPRFDWRRLARLGLSVWPSDLPSTSDLDKPFRSLLTAFGYPAQADDDTLLRAFRLRFRPWASGPLDAQDRLIAQSLTRFAVDRGTTSA